MQGRTKLRATRATVRFVTGVFLLLVMSGCASAPSPSPAKPRDLGAGFRWSLYGPDYDPGPEYWAMVGLDMARKFDGAQPEAIWIVSKVNGQGTLLNFPASARDPLIASTPEDGNEAILSLFDRLGFRVWLQVEPGFASVDELLDIVMARYRHHPSVVGFGIDIEWFRSTDPDAGDPVTDAQARAWVSAVRKHGQKYRLFVKHFDLAKMPPNEREGLLFVDDSQILPSLEAMVDEFAVWGRTFAPAPVAFQYGYPSDRPWWGKLKDPPRDIGQAILARVPNTAGLYWVDFTVLDLFPPAQRAARVFFDDFDYGTAGAMEKNGWALRGDVALLDGAVRMSSSERVLRSLLCHERKYLEGTYAARVRFTDQPVSGADGVPVAEAFSLISPAQPDSSQTDFEYLPNGGRGQDGPALFATTWETKADFLSASAAGSLDGWHTLVLQLGAGRRARYSVDGVQIAEHGGRHYPEAPMAIHFSIRLAGEDPRPSTWMQEVDWVFHQARAILTPAEVDAKVAELRGRKVKFTDTVLDHEPPLESPCD